MKCLLHVLQNELTGYLVIINGDFQGTRPMPCCFFFWPFKHFGLTAKQANPLTVDAIMKFPEFAPFYLCLGDIYCDQKDEAKALATYREGLQLVAKAMAALIRTM